VTDELLGHVQHQLAPDYDIGREVGRGGMAVVYSAVHGRDGRRLAIKVLPPQFAFFQAHASDSCARRAWPLP
jgi:serine/threonine protein kinase